MIPYELLYLCFKRKENMAKNQTKPLQIKFQLCSITYFNKKIFVKHFFGCLLRVNVFPLRSWRIFISKMEKKKIGENVYVFNAYVTSVSGKLSEIKGPLALNTVLRCLSFQRK